ncbi:MAG: ABC transporter permease [Defluviitaleaceae bacterium]|nr:ABC transporter permease [Defluviitaleaceae bacterium]
MRIRDVFFMALRSMLKRKMRTLLTVMGVVIGSAAITIMISLGVAVNMAFDQQIEELGARALRVEIWNNTWNLGPHDLVIDEDMVRRIQSIDGVRVATPMVNSWLNFVSGRYVAQLDVVGILPEAMEALGLNVAEGRPLDDDEGLQIVFGAHARRSFRDPRNMNMHFWEWQEMGIEADVDLIDVYIRASFDHMFGMPDQGHGQNQNAPRPYLIQGVGIIQEVEWDWDTTNRHYMPLQQVLDIESDRDRHFAGMGGGFGRNSQSVDEVGFSSVVVIAENANVVSYVAETIRDMGIENVWYSMDWIEQQRQSGQALQNLLAAVGAVSLFIAAIGIMNTMIMAIYERTKEIGVMKVIGATVKDVRRLFLLEAAMIGALGGAVGLGLSALISYLLNNAELPFFDNIVWGGTAYVSVIPMWLYGLAFGFSCVIGLLSGSWPARRATKISALAAIRTE